MTWEWSFLDCKSCFLYSVWVCPRILHLPQNPTPSHHVVIKDYNFRFYGWHCFSASPIPEQIHGVAICRFFETRFTLTCAVPRMVPSAAVEVSRRGRSWHWKPSCIGWSSVHRSWFRTLNHRKDRLLSSPDGIVWDWWWGEQGPYMKMSVVLKGFVFLETPHLRLAQLLRVGKKNPALYSCL